jgi:hypothetical protein
MVRALRPSHRYRRWGPRYPIYITSLSPEGGMPWGGVSARIQRGVACHGGVIHGVMAEGGSPWGGVSRRIQPGVACHGGSYPGGYVGGWFAMVGRSSANAEAGGAVAGRSWVSRPRVLPPVSELRPTLGRVAGAAAENLEGRPCGLHPVARSLDQLMQLRGLSPPGRRRGPERRRRSRCPRCARRCATRSSRARAGNRRCGAGRRVASACRRRASPTSPARCR